MFDFSNLFSGVLGAGLTLCATFFWRVRDERKQKSTLRASLRMELSTILPECKRFSKCLKDYYNTEKKKTAPPLHQNYTTVYDTNAGRVGTLGETTAASVVLAYTRLKVTIDTASAYLAACHKYLVTESRGTPRESYYPAVQNLCETLEEQMPRTTAAIEEAIRLLS